jgi:hypothetical protein
MPLTRESDLRRRLKIRAEDFFRPRIFAMKSRVSAIAASILTALAFTPASLPVSVSATATTTASAPSAQIAPTLETPIVLAQLSPENGDGSENGAGDQNESGDSPDGNSSTQSDDQGSADDAQNGDADNGDGDQSADNAETAIARMRTTAIPATRNRIVARRIRARTIPRCAN